MGDGGIKVVGQSQDLHIPFGFVLFSSIFIGCYAIAPLLAFKILDFGFALAPAGVITFSILFPCTDILTEVYGRRAASYTVAGGLVAIIFIAIATHIAIIWPAADVWDKEEAFNAIFGTSWQFFIGSLAAYSSQFFDVYLFDKIKKAFEGRYLWIRNNLSTLISQFIATTLFVCISFFGTYDVSTMTKIILSSMLVRVIFAATDTPIVYLCVWILNKRKVQHD